MAVARLAGVLALAALLALASAAFPEEDDVLVLGDDNIDDAIAAHETLLVEFYAPWCGHCKRLAPEYAKAAATLKKEGIRIAKVDATENAEAAEKYGVEGYPTLKFFVGGKATAYGGGRTEQEIVNWVRKKSGPAAVTLDTVDAAKAFTGGAEVAVVGLFASATSDAAKVFLRVAAQIDDVAFGISTSADVAGEYGATAPAIVLLKTFDEGRNDFTGEFTESDISTFVSANSLPLVIGFSQETAPKIFGGSIKTHLLVFTDSEDDVAGLTDVAKEIKGKLLTVSVDSGNDRVLGYFGITKADYPTAVIVNMPDGAALKKYVLGSKDVTSASLSAFVKSYTDGKLKPHLKSEEVPASDDGPVKVLVGKNFEQVALDESKDVLVEFYAPWCGHCKKLAPIYDQLAEKLAGVKSVVIAKMDSTANEVDHPEVNVQGFPTLIFFPAGPKKAQEYDGSRDLDGMLSFIKKNAKVPFTLADDGDDEEL